MKKILYLYSDTGGGHRASANALIKAVDQVTRGKVSQEMVDLFASSSKFLNMFAKLYSPVIKYTPGLWGALWYLLDDMNKLRKLQKLATPFIDKKLKELIKERPDLIVSVHPLMNHLTTKAMKDLGVKIPFITVVTDPVTFHRSWVDEEVDALVVATPEAEKRALEFGMPKEKVKLLGLPIRPDFALKDEEKASLREKMHQLEPGKFTVLMMGGGEGSGKMYQIIKALNDTKLDIQVIVICGRNKNLEEKLKSAAAGLNYKLRVYGFTEEVANLMSESDIIITKGGPGSIAEALAMNLPIIIMSWLPGQEEGNVKYVKDENVGRVSVDPREIAEIVKELQENKKEFARIKENIKRVRKPHASFDIAELLLKYLGKY